MYDSSLPMPPPVIPTTDQKQSKLGIASFVLGIIGMLLLCAGFLIAIGYGVSIGLQNPYITDPSSVIDSSDPIVLLASGFMYCSPVFNLVGLGLGIAAAFQKNTKKTLGIIGLVLNALIVLSFCCFFVFGLLVGAGALSL